MSGAREISDWLKSSYSGSGDCVQWRFAGGRVHVRHSQRPEGGVLIFSRSEWVAFLSGAVAGECVMPVDAEDLEKS